MLAGIKISDGSSKHKDDKKKKKKSKHKKRKLKKAKDSSSDSGSDSGASDDGEVVELQTAPVSTTSAVRDTWMTLPMKSPQMTAVLSDRAAKRDADEKKKQQEEEAREVLEKQAKIGGLKGDIRPITEKSLTAAPLVGDGGAKWRAKALLRAQERAREEGVDGETVMAERFGSLGAFKAKDKELRQEIQNQRGYSDKAREEQRHRFQRAADSSDFSQKRSSWREKAEENHSSRRREEVIPKAGQDEFGRDLGEGAETTSVSPAGEKKLDRVREEGGRQERWRKPPERGEREERERRDERNERNTERDRSPRRKSREREKEEDKNNRERRKDNEEGERRREERERERGKKEERETEKNSSKENEKGRESTESQKESGKQKEESRPAPEEKDPKKLAKKAQREAEQEKEIAERRAFLYATNRSRSDASEPKVVPQAAKEEEQEEEDDGREVSEADINKLAARALKARLMGEDAKASTLDQELAALKSKKARQPKIAVLSEMDAKGRLLSLKRPGERQEETPVYGQKQKRVQNKMVNGERVAYFDDDVVKTDLKSLVEAERLRGSEDYDANWAKNIVKNADFKEVSLEQQWDDVDVSMKMFQSKKDRLQKDKQAEYAHKTQVSEYNKLQRTLDNCRLCVAQAPQHLIIANGLRMYLSLPTHRIVTEGHCILAPVDHTPALTHFDEDVLDEFQYFRKHLVKMFAKQGKGVVFMETFMHPDRTPHSMIECVPLPLELFEEAAIYFKKEISDSDAKWSVHKKLIDTREKGLRKLVAKQAPYFSVEFGMEAGFAHVIEDTSKFPMDFGKSVLCGILEEPAQIVMRAKRQPEHMERARAEAFRQKWKPYDWTLRLKKNQPTNTEAPTPGD